MQNKILIMDYVSVKPTLCNILIKYTNTFGHKIAIFYLRLYHLS